eukprot:scaffold81410_cov63-Phaeocystis_antarctica.AAC.2
MPLTTRGTPSTPRMHTCARMQRRRTLVRRRQGRSRREAVKQTEHTRRAKRRWDASPGSASARYVLVDSATQRGRSSTAWLGLAFLHHRGSRDWPRTSVSSLWCTFRVAQPTHVYSVDNSLFILLHTPSPTRVTLSPGGRRRSRRLARSRPLAVHAA